MPHRSLCTLFCLLANMAYADCTTDTGNTCDEDQLYTDTSCSVDENSSFPEGIEASDSCLYFLSDNGLFSVINEEGKYGFLNHHGEVVIPLQYDYASAFRHGLAPVSQDDKVGFINEQGELVIPFQYDMGTPFIEGLSLVAKNGKYGFINPAGEIAIPLEYDDAWIFSHYGVAPASRQGKWALINKQGQPVTPFKYDYIGWGPSLGSDGFQGGFVRAGFDEITKEGISITKSGLIDYRGVEYIAPHEDINVVFHMALPAVRKDNTWYFLDDNIPPVTPDYPLDARVLYFTEGLSPIKLHDKYGFVDMQMNLIIPAIYDEIALSNKNNIGDSDAFKGFNNGIAGVKLGNKWGYIDTHNNVVVEPAYDSIEPFSDKGCALVEQNGKYGLVNRQGDTIIPTAYDTIEGNCINSYTHSWPENWLKVGVNLSTAANTGLNLPQHVGIFDIQGSQILPAVYQSIAPFANKRAIIHKDDQCGYIDDMGQIIIDIQYRACAPFTNSTTEVVRIDGTRQIIDTAGKIVE